MTEARVVCIFCGHSNEGCPTCQPENFSKVIAMASFIENEHGEIAIVNAMINGEEYDGDS